MNLKLFLKYIELTCRYAALYITEAYHHIPKGTDIVKYQIDNKDNRYSYTLWF